MVALVNQIQKVEASSSTIYIRNDGSVEGTPYIETDTNVTYVFTANINDSIVIERNNIVIDGKGYSVQGYGSATGLLLSNVNNVTVKNTNVTGFYYGVELMWATRSVLSENNITSNYDHGVHLQYSSENNISGNTLANNGNHGIRLYYSSNCSISGNIITHNYHDGVHLSGSSNCSISQNEIISNDDDGVHVSVSSDHNSIYGNIIANNENGIDLRGIGNNVTGNVISGSTACGVWLGITGYSTENNSISENSVKNNTYGVSFYCADYNEIFANSITESSICGICFNLSENNRIFHNNFIDNAQQACVTTGSVNTWDTGYPSGGNYWDDFTARYPNATEIDTSGLWNTSYVLDANNTDHYPLMNQHIIPEFPSTLILPLFMTATLLALTIYKRKHAF